MSEEQFDSMEVRLREAAKTFPYPATPDIAGVVNVPVARGLGRRLAIALAVVVLLLVGLFAVPQVRAGILDVLRLGAVRILVVEPTPTVVPPASSLPVTSPVPVETPALSVLDLAGETSLDTLRSRVGITIPLPAYPADLGVPDKAFLQDARAPVVMLVWLDKTAPGRVRLSLHVLGRGMFIDKVQPRVVQETRVNGARALWTDGPYLVIQRNGNYDIRRLIRGHVLVWQAGELTYRLETDLPLEEAIKIAESLR